MTSIATMRSIILTTLLTLLLLIATTDSQTTFNAKLKNGVKGTPGVKARLTKKGFNYMGRIIGNLFAEQVPLFTVPDIDQSLPNNGGTISLTDVHITKFQPPKRYQMSAAPPNQIRLSLIKMAVTSVGKVAGAVNIIMPLDLQGELEVEAEEIDVMVSTALEKTSDGLPRVRMLQCTVRIGKIRVFNHNGGVAGAGVNIFQKMVARQAKPVLQNVICLRAKELVDRDLNSRLSDNPPVVSLARARQIDLFGLEASQPMSAVDADQSANDGRRPLMVNGRMVRTRQKRQISRRIPQSLPSTHVMVHKPRIHQLMPMGSTVSERSASAEDDSLAEHYAYPDMQVPPQVRKNSEQSPTIMSPPAEASQFSPVFRAPAVRPPKPVRRRPGTSRKISTTPNPVTSEELPAQANLFAPAAIPAVDVSSEDIVQRPASRRPTVEVSRAETLISESPASPPSPSLPDGNERQRQERPQPEATSQEPEPETMVSELSLDELPAKVSKKEKTNNKVLNKLMEIFDLKETVESLFLDYSLVTPPRATTQFIEVQSAGEISYEGLGGTPFFPVVKPFPISSGEPKMLEVVVSDFLLNSLLYHANRLDLFNFNIDPDSKDIGQFLYTTCDDMEVAICLGSFLPSLQKFPKREIHLTYRTNVAPAVVFGRSSNGEGVVKIDIMGVLDVYTRKVGHVHHRLGSVDIQLAANAAVNLNGRVITAQVKFEKLNINTHDEKALPQADLNDLGLIAQEALEGIVNRMLEEGIPVPLHPIFELVEPQVEILDREMLLSTDIKVNEKALKELARKAVRTTPQRRNPIRQRNRVQRQS